MKSLTACLPWLLHATLSVSAAQIAQLSDLANMKANLPGPVIDRYIIELDEMGGKAQARSLGKRRVHELVYEALQEQGISMAVQMEYEADGLFYGASVKLNNPSDVEAIAKAPGVLAIRPVTTIYPAMPVPAEAANANVSNIAAASQDNQSTHVMTGVDKLHAKGITGKGVKIGIIDTGVDYSHPSLGGGFGPSFKVVGGYDFVGNDYDGSNTPKPGSNPLDQCNGHGTHVAGIIGANPGNQFGISGVAYDSKLYAYRVFGCTGSVTDDIIVAALLRADRDGNDIINLSLGGASGWTESTTSVIASRIAATGKTLAIAAGNDGFSGAWYIGSPGTAINGVAVASVENTHIPVQKAVVGGVSHGPILYFSLFPLPVKTTMPIYATSKDTTVTADACNPLPANTPDLSNYVVIIRRGTCTFVTKLQNVAAKGAKVALIYDNGNGFNAIAVGTYTASLIQAADGEFLVKQFAAGVKVTLTFPQSGSVDYQSPVGGLMSTFSSYGLTNDFYFKPSVAAPGGNILSTLPVRLGSFGLLSGTSMATPFIAGSTALLYQVKGKVGYSPRTLFETTAKSVPLSRNSGNPLDTAIKQGAGLVQVNNAINYQTVVTPGAIVLNDTTHFVGTHEITVKNNGWWPQTYRVIHVPASTAVTVGRFSIWPNLGPLPISTSYAIANINRQTFTLIPKGTTKIVVKFTPPAGLDPTTYPVYSGFIQIASSSETLHVPYAGLAASLIKKQVIDNTSNYFNAKLPLILKPNNQIQTGPTTYNFVNGNNPRLVFRLLFGTPLLRLELVKSDFTIKRLKLRELEMEEQSGTNSSSLEPQAVSTVGRLFQTSYLSRNDEDSQSNGNYLLNLRSPFFANGARIPNGSYRLLLRALRVTGNPNNDAHYDNYLSPIITIAA